MGQVWRVLLQAVQVADRHLFTGLDSPHAPDSVFQLQMGFVIFIIVSCYSILSLSDLFKRYIIVVSIAFTLA